MSDKRPMIDPGFAPCSKKGGEAISDGDTIGCQFLPISKKGGNAVKCDSSGLYVRDCAAPELYDAFGKTFEQTELG